MKYTVNPQANQARRQMVWRGRGRSPVEVIRRPVPVDLVSSIEADPPEPSTLPLTDDEPDTKVDAPRSKRK